MRQYIRVSALALGLAVGSAQPVFAHHSVTGTYDMSKSVSLTGTITKVEWINPHIFIHIAAKEANGTVTQWQLESLPVAMMRRAGLTKESVMGKPGEVVNITGIPARDGTSHLAIVSIITYADGHKVHLGLSGGAPDVPGGGAPAGGAAPPR